jgi:diacylglycerol kinase family enzyme
LRTRGRTAASAYTSWHDQSAFSIHANPEVPIQIDGEALGNVAQVKFTHHPEALKVIDPLLIPLNNGHLRQLTQM